MTDRPLPQLSIKEQRDRTISLLCEHYAQDRLDLVEFEARLDVAHRATTAIELTQLLQDLPAPTPPPPSRSEDIFARGADRLREELRDTRTMIAIMGGVERRGHWQPHRRNVVITMMGGAELDFREVQLPPGETELVLICVMGGAEIIVPPDLAVDASGIAIMGGFAQSDPPRSLPAEAPLLRIKGFCLMGGAEIVVRLPGETAKDARHRQREARRDLRRGRE
jgi:hypothetical protein